MRHRIAPHFHPYAINRRRAGAVQIVPVRPAPVHVAGYLRHADDAEVPALRVEHPDAARTGDVDVPVLVAFHAVHDAFVVVPGADAFGEDAAAASDPSPATSNARMCARRVVHVENPLVERQAQSIRLAEVVRVARGARRRGRRGTPWKSSPARSSPNTGIRPYVGSVK